MFHTLAKMPSDPILSVSLQAKADKNPDKIDLGVGVYKDDNGHTPVMKAVKAAEARYHELEDSKTYVGTTGYAPFNESLLKLVLGDETDLSTFASAQGAGGSGALRLGAEIIKRAHPEATVWTPTPTWGNHVPLISSAQLLMRSYPYYDKATGGVDFDAMVDFLKSEPRKGDVIVLHGCCHNPTGADLADYQWDILAELLPELGLVPFVDLAYLGLGDGLDEDSYGVRKMAATQETMLVAASCSKNFGLYRDRVGVIGVKTASADQRAIAQGHLGRIMRTMISMPPHHGAALVDMILNDDALFEMWKTELDEMRERMTDLRRGLAKELTVQGHESMGAAISSQKGMFSTLPVTPEQAAVLRDEHSVYLLDSGRVNIAGATEKNIPNLARAILSVM